MIPKIIHYCWFGNNEKPESVKEYIKTWQRYCPDYKIIEWNEINFDVTQNSYCYGAYISKKWAFVTDYVRLKVLYDYGGIYMDADVEVIKPLDDLLVYEAVTGYELDNMIPTGTMAASKNNEWIRFLLKAYDNISFIREDGSLDLTSNVVLITRLTKEHYHVNLTGDYIIFDNNIALLPYDYLCAKSFKTGEVNKTNNTYTIHHFLGSWLPDLKERNLYHKLWNKLTWLKIIAIKRIICRSLVIVYFEGWIALFKKVGEKLFRLNV